MNRIIKSLALAAGILFAGAAVAEDSFLYWMWEGENYSGAEWTYAKVVGVKADGQTYLTVGVSDGYKFEDVIDGAFYEQYAKLKVGETYTTYLLELFYGDKAVAVAELSAEDANVVVGMTGTSGGESVFGAALIPEPTSGMLALLGLALMGLRRKQKIA